MIQNVYFSRRDVRTPMKVSYMTMLVNILLAIILMNRIDVRGLALAVSIAGIFQFSLLIKPHIEKLKRIAHFLGKIIFIAILATVPVIYIERSFIPILSLILGSIVFGLIFIGGSYILKIEEICQILKR